MDCTIHVRNAIVASAVEWWLESQSMADCSCEFRNVGDHVDGCELEIPLIRKLEKAKDRVIKLDEFDAAAAIRDAIIYIRKARGPKGEQ